MELETQTDSCTDTLTIENSGWLRVEGEALLEDDEADTFGIHIRPAEDVGLGGLLDSTIEDDQDSRLVEDALDPPRRPWISLVPPLRPRILLAEDDAEMRQLVASELEAAGYEVISCRDGYELLARIARVRHDDEPVDFDLIISDIQMPGVDGLSLLEGLRQWAELRPLQMILMTAFGDERTHRRARIFGAAKIFDKPFEMADLLAKVREILPSPRNLDAASKRNGPRVLLADRNPKRRAQLARALSAVGYKVEICRSTVALKSRLADVVLFGNLDCYDALVCSDSLPGGSLWDLLREVDNQGELPPILLVGSVRVHQPVEEMLLSKAARCDPSLTAILRELRVLTR